MDASGDLSLNLRPSSATSAPSSPARTVTSFLSRGASLTSGAAKNLPYAKDRHLTLLVVDDARTDWAKYFQGRKLHGNWDVRVEQAEFGDLTLWASTESGTTVSMGAVRQGTKVVRSFRPDFVLVRQHVRDAGRDYRPLLLGLHFGGVPTVNSLHSLYNFQDKPWVFTQLQSLQRRLGRENFPLVEQSFFPNHTEMLTANKFPCVVKVGHAHGGLGKMKVENNQDFQEVASVVALTGSYCVVEPLVDTRCDLHVQKIGTSYKAFVRKSISGNWKANIGSAILEQVPMTERYKQWVDAVSELFGGLDICAVEAIQGKDGREYITEANDSAMQLLGETQEEDRRLIAELVLQRMQQYCRPPGTAPPKQPTAPTVPPRAPEEHPPQEQNVPPQSVGGPPSGPPPGPPPQPRGPMPTDPQRLQRGSSGAGNPPPPPQRPQGGPASLFRRESQSSEKSEDPDDTMRNLRKTFAGIFGDM